MSSGILLGKRDSEDRWDSRHRHLNTRIPAEQGNDRGVDILQVDLPEHIMPSPPAGGQDITTVMATIRHGLGEIPYYMVYMVLNHVDNPFSLVNRYALNYLLLGQGGQTWSYLDAKVDEENLYVRRVSHTGGTAIPSDNFAGDTLRFKYIIVNTPAVGHFNIVPPGLEV